MLYPPAVIPRQSFRASRPYFSLSGHATTPCSAKIRFTILQLEEQKDSHHGTELPLNFVLTQDVGRWLWRNTPPPIYLRVFDEGSGPSSFKLKNLKKLRGAARHDIRGHKCRSPNSLLSMRYCLPTRCMRLVRWRIRPKPWRWVWFYTRPVKVLNKITFSYIIIYYW